MIKYENEPFKQHIFRFSDVNGSAVDRSFLDKYKVDLWLPGAPTHPMCFIDGITRLREKK